MSLPCVAIWILVTLGKGFPFCPVYFCCLGQENSHKKPKWDIIIKQQKTIQLVKIQNKCYKCSHKNYSNNKGGPPLGGGSSSFFGNLWQRKIFLTDWYAGVVGGRSHVCVSGPRCVCAKLFLSRNTQAHTLTQVKWH